MGSSNISNAAQMQWRERAGDEVMAECRAQLRPREVELDFTSATRSRLDPYGERDRFIHRFPQAENSRLKAPEELQRAT